MSRNAEVAEILEEFADLLDAKDVEYKPRSYRRAAENVYDYPVAIEELARDGPNSVQEIEGVGEAIASKIVEYVESGHIEELDELREELPVRMDELTAVEGVGPKSVGSLFSALGITTLEELEEAANAGEIQSVEGFGEKSEANIREHIPFAKEAQRRELLGHGRPVADEVLSYLDDVSAVARVEVAGSIRRWRPTIGDIDILAATEKPTEVVEAFTSWERIDRVTQAGETKASVRARGIQIDIRVVHPDEWGAALQYFTGSKDHNVRLRNRAIARDLKMNEYGVFDVTDISPEERESSQRVGTRIAGENESGMYEALSLPWIPPELREDTGEIDAAANGALPEVLDMPDVLGDLHVHTSWSDGNESIEGMARAADSFGHEYIAICDHATGPGMVGGVGISDDELVEQIEAIRSIDQESSTRILAGVESNIDEHGDVSVRDDVLEKLDLVVASPHSNLDQGTNAATDRLIQAIEHPSVDILGHPTGRLLNSRPGLKIDIGRIAAAAAAHDTVLEVNANPRRLDIDGTMIRAAIDAGAMIAINTDAHSPGEYRNIRYGIHTARRGWATADDTLNAFSVDELTSWLHS